MITDLFLRSQLQAAIDSAQHVANGAIGVREMTDPDGAKAMLGVQRIYERELERLLEGKVSTKQKQACTGRPRFPAPFCGDWRKCMDGGECGECPDYQLYREKVKENFRDEPEHEE